MPKTIRYWGRTALPVAVMTAVLLPGGCQFAGDSTKEPDVRLSMFVGVDISGSFIDGGHFDDALDFLAYYLHAHLEGQGGLERPAALFVSSIGGARAEEPKTFYPIQNFDNKSVEEIRATLGEMFRKDRPNPFTDYNAFFEQVAHTVRSRNLLLRPISVIMVSDGIPDVRRGGQTGYESIRLGPLEHLARSVTVRLLYTDAVVGKAWQTQIPRRRIRVWTQDANVMTAWRDEHILLPEQPMAEQERFFAWVRDNVDFGVRARRVN